LEEGFQGNAPQNGSPRGQRAKTSRGVGQRPQVARTPTWPALLADHRLGVADTPDDECAIYSITSMKDPRVVEIEFLAELDQNSVGSIVPWDYVKKLGVSPRFFRDMILSLFWDGCLEGTDSIMAPHDSNPDRLHPTTWGIHQRQLSLASLLQNTTFSAYINHKGRIRLWNLRDQLQKTRTKEKFGILWDRRDWTTEVTVGLAMLKDDAPSSVIFADVDGFKPVNDKLGHAVGDDVLRMIFDTVATLTKGMGETYGWGGDEVVVFLPGVDAETAGKRANAIEAQVAQQCAAHPALSKAALLVTISVGCYSFTGRESADAIASKADERMFEAKRAKKAGR
jgi:diguanylate cyclase (GGDEF)-like protein